jgi:malate dehydrogenase (oxaloacetate-decarboxylating)(NADP+)
MASGVATRPIEDLEAYRTKLHSYISGSRLFIQSTIELARKNPARIAYAEGENDDVLLAMQAVVDEKVAKPILVGRPSVIQAKIEKMGLRIKVGHDVDIFNVEEGDLDEKYWRRYHSRVGRDGVSVEAAKTAVHTSTTVMAALLVDLGEADGMICGKVGRFDEHLKHLTDIFKPQRGSGLLSSVCALLLEDGPLVLADPFVNVDPTAEEIVGIAKDAIEFARGFNIEPKVALLSHSNFGTYEDSSALKMKKAAAILRAEFPDLQIDGEMHSLSALNPKLRATICEDNRIEGRANILIMPNMDAASISLGLIRSLTDARLVGPFLSGLEKSAHIMIPSVSGRGILNMSALTAADVHYRNSK